MDAQLYRPTVDIKYVLRQFVLPFIRARYNRRAKAGRDAYAKIMDGQCPQCNAGLLAGNPPMPKFLNPSVFPNMVLYYHFVEEKHDTAIPGLELSAIFVD